MLLHAVLEVILDMNVLATSRTACPGLPDKFGIHFRFGLPIPQSTISVVLAFVAGCDYKYCLYKFCICIELSHGQTNQSRFDEQDAF